MGNCSPKKATKDVEENIVVIRRIKKTVPKMKPLEGSRLYKKRSMSENKTGDTSPCTEQHYEYPRQLVS